MLDDKLVRWGAEDDAAWRARCAADLEIASQNQSPELQDVTTEVLTRARASGALAVVLTGSTARAKRTAISDLDYHVVGVRPSTRGLPAEVDVYAGDAAHLTKKIGEGDDFVQWSLRCGCILFDSGVLRAAARLILNERVWPDGARKLQRLPSLSRLARSLIEMEDRDAAQEQVRATLTSASRAILLLAGAFPFSRSELADQLRSHRQGALADHLEMTIYGEPSLSDLGRALDVMRAALPAESVAA